ncbi:DUF302 domain-containing protein [Phenylobacterium sp.]|uniref:DUF302 domain-containing protein n=1 Tax=Phenylobacterium sp. TaxID=1871053 RepID=UPI0011F6FD5F|nr:DUF302 domain-containing protein [Phenylobacterium sp.]THD56341.1 MAG: DUF302 domain-containing protein [Phenylobacterium sp.]
MPVEGLKVICSRFSAKETVDRLKDAIAEAGLTLFAHIDQAAAARSAGASLPPLDLLLFGNPHAGTPLMASHPTVGIDLPLKALVWQDSEAVAWIAFNDPAWIATRHHLGEGSQPAVEAMARLQARLVAQAGSSVAGGKG